MKSTMLQPSTATSRKVPQGDFGEDFTTRKLQEWLEWNLCMYVRQHFPCCCNEIFRMSEFQCILRHTLKIFHNHINLQYMLGWTLPRNQELSGIPCDRNDEGSTRWTHAAPCAPRLGTWRCYESASESWVGVIQRINMIEHETSRNIT